MSPSFLLAVPAMDFSCCTSCRACATETKTVKLEKDMSLYGVHHAETSLPANC